MFARMFSPSLYSQYFRTHFLFFQASDRTIRGFGTGVMFKIIGMGKGFLFRQSADVVALCFLILLSHTCAPWRMPFPLFCFNIRFFDPLNN
uniref:Uncharacterized protein n=1 Tax=uncultured marine virus TaxID=186617 RepID=A0A0F7L2P6_9VIRU|nr:hypothetical protein [uncultured marine virus]